MFAGKPIIGIAGGIGSGKSWVADLFGEQGCCVIHSDQQVHDAYRRCDVTQAMREWWGERVFNADGEVDRKAVARIILPDAGQRERLEGLLHPIVSQMREQLMADAARNPETIAFVWDTPLLFEANLQGRCDAIVFVEAPLATRFERVASQRRWDQAELVRRENLQWPLDIKREISQYVIDNTADADYARGQVKDVLSRIVARWG